MLGPCGLATPPSQPISHVTFERDSERRPAIIVSYRRTCASLHSSASATSDWKQLRKAGTTSLPAMKCLVFLFGSGRQLAKNLLRRHIYETGLRPTCNFTGFPSRGV